MRQAAHVEHAVRVEAVAAGFVLDGAQDRALPLLAALACGRTGGAYLWGPPGRGKTWLVDAALRAADRPDVHRVHAHALFAALHAATGAGYAAGQVTGAWERALGQVLEGVRLLVLDELHLSDSDDVWIAERLLRRLLERGGSLVVTSNTAVPDLHRSPRHAHHADGLRALLAGATTQVAFAGEVDHRTRAPAADRPGFCAGAFLAPGTAVRLADLGLARPGPLDRTLLEVAGRPLPVAGATGDTVWVPFRSLCERPTAAGDFVALAGRFRTWVVVGVPPLATCSADVRLRLLHAVDVAHDRDVRLVLVARQGLDETLGPPDLVPGGPRLHSRLALLRRPPAPVRGGVVTRSPWRTPGARAQAGPSTSATTSAVPS